METAACGADVTPRAGTVVTDRGAVTGLPAGKTWAYRGIPFATAPRLQRPADVACWSGERAAKDWAPKCAQLDTDGKPIGVEDCLTLNVWSPNDDKQHAVMVFIHGGGHAVGSAAQQLPDGKYLYDAESLATKGDVVVVTIQYRVGPLGWLAHEALAAVDPDRSSGMLGLLDQVAALQWVKRNIARFGGDASRVTIFGESAGGVSVCNLVASPLAKGLFSGAIMQSGGCAARARADAEAFGKKVADAAGCTSDVTTCLRALPLDKLLTSLPAVVNVAGSGTSYSAVIDGYALPAAPLQQIKDGKHNAVPFVFGSNTDETSRSVPAIDTVAQYEAAVHTLFPNAAIADQVLAQYPAADYPTPRRAMVVLTTDAKFICPLRHVGEALVAAPAYRYVFGYVAENLQPLVKALGASHGSELVYVFDHLNVSGYAPTARDQAMADLMIGHWSTFAKTGVAPWTKWDRATDPHFRFDVTSAVANGVRTAQCDFWDALLKI
jgi:para-nitrobenzyl esterase